MVKVQNGGFPRGCLAEGCTVYVCGSRGGVKTGEYVVASIGRDYFYLDGLSRRRFRLSDWREDSRTGAAASAYPSKEVFDRLQRIWELQNAVRDAVLGHTKSGWENLSLEDLEAIAALMKIEIEEDRQRAKRD